LEFVVLALESLHIIFGIVWSGILTHDDGRQDDRAMNWMRCHPPQAVLNVMFLSIEEAKTNILSKADILVLVWPLVAFPVAEAPLSKPGGKHCTCTWLLQEWMGEEWWEGAKREIVGLSYLL
jgi:hypothetical protein